MFGEFLLERFVVAVLADFYTSNLVVLAIDPGPQWFCAAFMSAHLPLGFCYFARENFRCLEQSHDYVSFSYVCENYTGNKKLHQDMVEFFVTFESNYFNYASLVSDISLFNES